MQYHPDKFVLVKVTSDKEPQSFYRVFASWYGGYLSGDSWKMNSGCTSVQTLDNCYVFTGKSSSQYICHKDTYGCSGYSAGVLYNMEEQCKPKGIIIEVVQEEDLLEVIASINKGVQE